jgi:predicted MFS family arabinose efflux permease
MLITVTFYNSFSFLIMIFVIFKIKWETKKLHSQKKPFWKTWRDGLFYTKNHILIFQSLILTFIASSTLATYTMFMPIITKSTYHGNSTIQGYLLAASGIGAIIASLLMTSQKSSLKILFNKIIFSSSTGICALLILVNNSVIWLGMIAMCLLGGSLITIFISLNSIIQLTVAEDQRGKVMSFFTMAFMGATPLSNFLTGCLIDQTGIAATMSGLSAIFLMGVIYFYLKIRAQANLILPSQ